MVYTCDSLVETSMHIGIGEYGIRTDCDACLFGQPVNIHSWVNTLLGKVSETFDPHLE